MKRFQLRRWGRLLPALGILCALLVPFSDPLPVQGTSPTVTLRSTSPSALAFAPGVVLVRRRTGIGLAALTSMVRGANATESLTTIGVDRLAVPVGQERAIADQLRQSGMVSFAEPDYVRHITASPNDPLYAQQWSLPQIDAPTAWQSTVGSRQVVVAVIDTGFDLTHPDRPVNLIQGPTYSSLGTEDGCPPEGVVGPDDDNGHGTHVGGIIAAAMNNDVGVTGVAPDVTLLVIKAADCQGSLADSDVALALAYAVSAGARIINLSFGGTTSSDTLDVAVASAWAGGALIVAAAGNDGANEPFYPADLPNVVAVAATDQSDTLASFSNWGSSITIAAPGTSILSTIPPNAPITAGANIYYATLSGTSMASPLVAGVAALVLSTSCNASNSALVSAIEQGAIPMGGSVPNAYYGYGQVDAAGAMRASQAMASVAASPTPIGVVPRAFLPFVPSNAC